MESYSLILLDTICSLLTLIKIEQLYLVYAHPTYLLFLTKLVYYRCFRICKSRKDDIFTTQEMKYYSRFYRLNDVLVLVCTQCAIQRGKYINCKGSTVKKDRV